MKHKWAFKKLSDVCDRIGDGLHGTPEYVDGGAYHFVNGNNLKDGYVSINEATKAVGQEEFDAHRVELSESTLLLSINGTIGSMALYRGEPIVLGKSAAYINCRDVDRRFCYYYFQLKGVNAAFYNIATGSTIKNLGLDSLKSFKLPIPPRDIQEQIAGLLSLIDAKIHLNNRINEELEGMAKLLYDYWFVQFDFPITAAQAAAMKKPRLEGKPYRASGGKMVFNEALQREIPDGWEESTLSYICDSVRDTIDPAVVDPATPYVGLEHMPRRKFFLDAWEFADSVKSLKSRFVKGDILFGKLRPYFHKVVKVAINGVCTSELLVLRAREKQFEGLVGSIVFSDLFVESTSKQWGGAQMPRADWKRMEEFRFPLPPDDLLESFNVCILPLWKLGGANQRRVIGVRIAGIGTSSGEALSIESFTRLESAWIARCC